MKGNNDGFVRADQIDLKSLDEQLERHLNKAWTLDNNHHRNSNNINNKLDSSHHYSATTATAAAFTAPVRQRHEWEIDPAKLIIKSVLARGTFGTVHRGIYDGLDVAGQFTLERFKLS